MRRIEEKWKKSSIEELRKRVEEYCNKRVSQEARLLELGWCIEKVIVTYVQYERYGEKRCHVEVNRRQGIIKNRQRWCECQKKKEKKVACPTEEKAQ